MKKFLIVASITVMGCAGPRTVAPVAIYDFGSQRLSVGVNSADTPERLRLPASLLVAEVTAPAWLDNTAIQYRLAYDDLAQSHAYASHRWAASPATLLTQRIRNLLAVISDGGVVSTADGARTDHILRIELGEFTQVFDTPDQSRVVVRFRASLIDRATRSVIAQRSFSGEQPAPSPNAKGAVRSLTDSSDKLIAELIGWLAEEIKEKDGPG
ncbi:ABC-type transport auxiliary lipoprotein family protein [Nitrosospira sp. Is2]|uniref:ABC-type transport auxiliary lipoprotein family protein n=1 Tax=Nitrosospira sp. Is2 TaxID=3080532 RepID=UPI0029550E9D|nr:ABC-type transport auxiliary lipoprotein family protein [Nitrosospira sp. Is2]WON74509.1 ABC-type transport auxiliary lipoprotein family protein [Nitrosospira sp. Is2]